MYSSIIHNIHLIDSFRILKSVCCAGSGRFSMLCRSIGECGVVSHCLVVDMFPLSSVN